MINHPQYCHTWVLNGFFMGPFRLASPNGWSFFGEFTETKGFPSMFSTNIRQKALGTHQGTGTTGG